MSDSNVTIYGNVASDVQFRETPSGLLTSFRLASQRRYYNRRSGRWVDDDPSFYRVVCWRGLAENVRDCLRKGEPVIVQGRMKLKDWTDDDGIKHTDGEVDAFTVGYDLTRGTALFTRAKRQQVTVEDGEDPLEYIRHEQRANAEHDVIVDPSTGQMFRVGELQSARPAGDGAGRPGATQPDRSATARATGDTGSAPPDDGGGTAPAGGPPTGGPSAGGSPAAAEPAGNASRVSRSGSGRARIREKAGAPG